MYFRHMQCNGRTVKKHFLSPIPKENGLFNDIFVGVDGFF